MTHELGMVHCGTAGQELGERTITIYQGSVLDFAVYLKHEGMVAAGMTPKQIAKAKRILDRGYHDLIEYLEEHGVPYTYHQPHPANFDH